MTFPEYVCELKFGLFSFICIHTLFISVVTFFFASYKQNILIGSMENED